jgi:TPR repeat protein
LAAATAQPGSIADTGKADRASELKPVTLANPAKSQPALARNFDDQKLLTRAEALVRQGDIVGARILLEHTLDKGSARAAFMLAETHDERMLRSWGTYGIRADKEKARELYARAAAAGIEAARERLEALKMEVTGSSR